MPSQGQVVTPTSIQANEAQHECCRNSGHDGTAAVKAAPAARAASRSGSLDCFVRREVGPACAQRAAMLISDGGFCFAQPPAVGKRSTAGEIDTRFSSQVNGEPPSQSATSGSGLLRNASKCSEPLRNVLLGMTYCLGHPFIAASNGPVGNQYPFCKSMQSSAEFCRHLYKKEEICITHTCASGMPSIGTTRCWRKAHLPVAARSFTSFAMTAHSQRSARGTSGGHIVKEKFSIGDYGNITLVSHPDGNIVGFHSMP
jgi:hypothetical protein